MTSRIAAWQRGALPGLALFLACGTAADDTLRERVHREYKHRSYMLVEDAKGARLFLFDRGISTLHLADEDTPVDEALEKTRSDDARTRVLGLVELAGTGAAAALDTALTLLADPEPAVRDEARQLILDHPDGQPVADALGLVDDNFGE
jgi:hypothetical protein